MVSVGALFFAASGVRAQTFEQQVLQINQTAVAAAQRTRQATAASQTQKSAIQDTEWQTVSGPDGSFTAEMPDYPQYQERAQKSPAGTAYTLRSYVIFESSRAFVIQTMTYPQDVDVSNPQVHLQKTLDIRERGVIVGKWASVTWKTGPGFTSVDLVGRSADRDIHDYYLMKGSQLFYVFYSGPFGTAQSADVNRFINSLVVR